MVDILPSQKEVGFYQTLRWKASNAQIAQGLSFFHNEQVAILRNPTRKRGMKLKNQVIPRLRVGL